MDEENARLRFDTAFAVLNEGRFMWKSLEDYGVRYGHKRAELSRVKYSASELRNRLGFIITLCVSL